MRSRLNRVIDWLFRGLAVWNGLWCFTMVNKLEQDMNYPLAKGGVLIVVFLVLMVICLWFGNCYPEWLGKRPFLGMRKGDSRGVEGEQGKDGVTMKRKADLCGPCIARIGEAYNLIRVAGGVNRKVICSRCGKKRYGATYEMAVKKKAIW